MKKPLIYSILLLLPSLVVSTSCSTSSSENISLSGAFALYPLAVKWGEEYRKLHPDTRIDISGGGAGKGMADALAGAVDLGMFSREISPAEKEKGVWWITVAKDAVLPTISASNPFLGNLQQKGLSSTQFRQIFITKEISTWGQALSSANADKINLYTRSDAAGAAATWAQFLQWDAKQENLQGIGVFGDPGLAEAVSKDPLAIGFNNVAYVYNINTGEKRPGIEVIPIDVNENGRIDPEEDFYDHAGSLLKAIAGGKYPSPPARELYFVSDGLPENKAVLAFLKWILTDGQQYVKEAGYVPVDTAILQSELQKLNGK
ncbi:phosphate transport system substrate-binding protein [Anseongella ginsenosidimutans]|uniref:Phosphate transport system substrate-binding protein n=1 Tax=Anseongella ginsenosidimutans TaxID=496056 RepID=A0A4R3KPJ6_9SPHI|nr:substrate-binding domain-containing protein [Anseongella ginsenosidimutans]QEC53649.1 phosphate ABC transporter substrate-binding protein [Anseongella ginsenosidimutans]TCS86102.1 phosphate transport system substrate-binding protein [Anseongella ginsenosidimutans]